VRFIIQKATNTNPQERFADVEALRLAVLDLELI
jgi:hypothetical protein